MEEAKAALDELGRSRAFVAKLEALVQELHNQRLDDQAEFHSREEGLQRRIQQLEQECSNEKGSSDRVHKLHCEEVFHLTSQLEEAQRLAAMRQKAFEQLSRELKMVLRQKITAESHLVLLQRNMTDEGGPRGANSELARLRARNEELEDELRVLKMSGATPRSPSPLKQFADNRVDQRVPMLEAELERERREADIQLNRITEEKARMEKEMLLRMELMEREINHLRKWNDTLAANAPCTRDSRPPREPETSQADHDSRHVLEGGRVHFKDDVDKDDCRGDISIPSRGNYTNAQARSALAGLHMRPPARPSPPEVGAIGTMDVPPLGGHVSTVPSRGNYNSTPARSALAEVHMRHAAPPSCIEAGTLRDRAIDMPPLKAKPKGAMDPEDAWRELDNVKLRIDRIMGRL